MLEAVPTVSSGRNRRLAPQASHLKGAAGGPIFDFGPFRASEGAPDRPVGAPDPPGARHEKTKTRLFFETEKQRFLFVFVEAAEGKQEGLWEGSGHSGQGAVGGHAGTRHE